MRTSSAAIAASALLLAGCGGGSDQAPQENRATANQAGAESITTAAELNARIEGLEDAPRNAAFIRAIRDANRNCQHVERSAPRAAIGGSPAWTAWCRGGGEWIILVADNNRLQVAHADELRNAGVDPGAAE